jgi:hypothetical protein
MKFKNLALFALCFPLFNSGVLANPPEITFIKRTSKRGNTVRETLRYRDKAILRRRRNEALFGTMQIILEKHGYQNKTQLFELAKRVRENNEGTPPIDRLAKRVKDCLICWFCENFVSTMNYLNIPVNSLPGQAAVDDLLPVSAPAGQAPLFDSSAGQAPSFDSFDSFDSSLGQSWFPPEDFGSF